MSEDLEKKDEVLETEEKNAEENESIIDPKQKELDDTLERLKRVKAEFENYKKRSEKERGLLYNTLLADIIGSFLPVIDILEKATQAESKDKEYKQGVELVYKQFTDVITSLGVEKIESVGTTFDPELHDAVSLIQDEKYQVQEIVSECRSGYKLGTKVIRHAMVVVAN